MLCVWENQVLLTDGQVVFPRVLQFSPTFDEQSARYKWNIFERAVKPKLKKKYIYNYISALWCRSVNYPVKTYINDYFREKSLITSDDYICYSKFGYFNLHSPCTLIRMCHSAGILYTHHQESINLFRFYVLIFRVTINPCPAEIFKMPSPLLISSQSDYLIWMVAINSHI